MKRIFVMLVILIAARGSIRPQVTVIANKSVPADSLDTPELRDIYSLDTRHWEDGTVIVPLILKGNEEVSRLFYSCIERKPLDMRKLWLRKQLSGEGDAPVALGSDEEIIAKVASTPGAIGFIHTDRITNKVKALRRIP